MWNKYTSIKDQEVELIKEKLIKDGKIASEYFTIDNNLCKNSGATHYPIVLIIDSIETKSFDNAIEVISEIIKCKDILSDSIDIAVVEYSSTVTINRVFSYIEENFIFSPSDYQQDALPNLGPALFLSWYISELRILQYTEAGIDYKQPVFILISSFINKCDTQIEGKSLFSNEDSWMISLYNQKQAAHKLGLIKVPIYEENTEYYIMLNGTRYDKKSIRETLQRLFAILIKPIAASDVPEREGDLSVKHSFLEYNDGSEKRVETSKNDHTIRLPQKGSRSKIYEKLERQKLREALLRGDGTASITQDNPIESPKYIDAAEERQRLRKALLHEGQYEDSTNILRNRYIILDDDGSSSKNSNNVSCIQVPNAKLAGGADHVRCKKCGNIYWKDYNFCPECGTKQFCQNESGFILSRVNFSATAPKKLSCKVFNIIHLIVYEDEYRSVVNNIIQDKEIPQREIPGGTTRIADESIVKIVLKSADFEIYYEEERTWKGRYIDFSIPVKLPAKFDKKQVAFQTLIYVNDIIATRLSFVVKCEAFRSQKISISREDIFSAFISYASQDRSKAAMVIQGIRKARPDMDIFFDVESLRSGENWENTIHEEIGQRDILYLFWSNYAKQSKWVNTEWRYAYSINGEDGIEPIPLEPAWECPPPEELKNKHFNDNLLYLINQNTSKDKKIRPEGIIKSQKEVNIDKEYLIAKIAELKELLEIGLYSENEYENDRKALLEAYRKNQKFLK
ncbi:MAG: TIR domain-containing protein [Lachnospiraceae bacterium]